MLEEAMEPEVLSYQHAPAPLPLDGDTGEAGSEEEDFGAFAYGLAASAHPPFLKSGFRLRTDHSSRDEVKVGRPSWHLTNGYCGAAEETGFADFTVFTEQAAHPWCCGFAPLGGAAVGTKLSSSLREGRQVVMDAEPRSCCQNGSSQDKSRQTATLQEEHVLNKSTAEDLDSLYEDVSFEGPSEDSEPNVSSLASHGDQTGDEDESLSEWDLCSHPGDWAASQGTTSNNETFDNGVDGETRGLPPSDSFADFCSATTQEDGDGTWAEFKDTRSKLVDQVGSLQFLQASFPEEEVPLEEDNVPSLGALLHPQEEEHTSQGVQRGFWRPHQDIHSAAGLKFQWGASHANRTLLRCLGVHTLARQEPKKDC
ncbi:aftiphilin-like [Nerophis ophidion]|uniref:aftiphilin-like n=1 Tax=Nerophis ophidion TaxID=159077 RepID=UPI002ADF4BFC|nr:aftiphilin-like [Nerophis ophidion]XP_061767287.1 aftiphilin-like [Nerophis ophidion]